MKKFLASLIFLGMLCGAASADFVYSTTNGKLGIINISGSDSVSLSDTRYNGSKENSIIATYWENNTSNGDGNSKLLLVTRASNPASNDTAVRFQGSNIAGPIDDVNNPINLQNTHNAQFIYGTQSGGGVYIASGACVRMYGTDKFNLEKTFDEYKSDDIVPNPEIKGLILNSTRVYILLSRNKKESNDLFYELDGQISTKVKNTRIREVSPLTKTMQYISNSRIAIGHATGVDIYGSGKILSSDAPVVSLCSDNGDGLYYVTQSNDVYELYHYSSSTKLSTLMTNATGNHAGIYHTDNNTLTAIMGGEMKFYKMENDSLFKTFTSADLGGIPYNITAAVTGGDSGSSGSSGCNLISDEGLGIRNVLILMLIALGLAIRRGKNSSTKS